MMKTDTDHSNANDALAVFTYRCWDCHSISYQEFSSVLEIRYWRESINGR